MAVTSESTTIWTGDLFTGSGTTKLDTSKAAELKASWQSRSEDAEAATTPEEMLAAAHSSCFAMAFSNTLKSAGAEPKKLRVTAAVTFDPKQPAITGSHLIVDAEVGGIDEAKFQELAEAAKVGCPVSKALTGIEISLEARLNQ